MKTSYMLSLCFLMTVAVLAYFIDLMGIVSFALLMLGWWVLLITCVLWPLSRFLKARHLWIKRSMSARPILVSLLIMFAGGGGLLVLNLHNPAPVLSASQDVGEQLRYMYESDQGDRFVLRALTMAARDQQRRSRVMDLYEQGRITTPQDQYYAAMIFQHGTAPADYQLAYNLARMASEHGVTQADWLSKAAYDRWMVSLGRSQRYGTQSSLRITPWGWTSEQR